MHRRQHPPLTLEAFGRSAFVKEFKRRLEQAAAKSPLLLIKGATGGMAEICARTLQPPRAPWLDLSTCEQRANPGNAGKGHWRHLIFVPDLSALGKMQQMNLAYAVDRLEKLNLQLHRCHPTNQHIGRGRLGQQTADPPW
jgi:two-component system nitrogen regulation response regulator NtrX